MAVDIIFVKNYYKFTTVYNNISIVKTKKEERYEIN